MKRLLLFLYASALLAVTNVTVTQTIYTTDNSLANGTATISLTGPCTDRSDGRITREVPVTVSIVNGAFSRSLQATSKCMENPGPQYKVVFSFTNDAVTTRIRYWHVYADGTVEETAEQRSRWVSVASPLNITDSGISCSTCLSSAATYPDPSWLPSLSASKISGGTLSAGRMPALTGEVTTSAGSVATTIAAGAVSTAKVADNAVTNAKLATMADQRLKGNVSGGTAAPSDLTAAQVAAMLPAFVGDSGSGGTKGLVPAPASGDATKFLRADGTWTLIAPGLIDILSLSELSDVTAKTGTGTTVVMSASPTITTPTIASFANANHTHQNAAGGGTLDGAAIASGTIDVGRISQAAVTQHQAALSIATSQLTGTLPDARVAQSNVTQHQTALAIAQSQVTGLVTALAGKSATGHTHDAGDTTSGTFVNARIAQSNVTQHQAALAINAPQVGTGSVDNTEFGYLDGVTSAIQTQLAGKSNTGHTHGLADITSGTSVPPAANTLVVRDSSGGGYLSYLSSVRSATDGNVVPLETKSIATVNNTGTYYAYAGYLLTQTAIAAGRTNSGYVSGLTIDVFRSGAGDLGTLASNFGLRIHYGHYQPGAVGARTTTSAVGMMLVPYVGMGTITDIYGIQVSPQQSGATVSNSYGIYMAPFGAATEWGIYQTSPSTQRNLMGSTLFGSSTSQFSATVTVRDERRNAFEWGHPNTSGYGNTLGFENSSGTPYVCFYCSAGTNTNTYKTWGNKGSVIANQNGVLTFGRVPVQSADNQSLRVDALFQDDGQYIVYNTIKSYNATGEKGFLATSSSVQVEMVATDASGGYGILGTTTNHSVLFRVGNTNKMQLASDAFVTEVSSHQIGAGRSTQDVFMDVGGSRSGSGHTYIDLIGDTTYTDYGLRMLRYAGPNAGSQIQSRGTGAFEVGTSDAASFGIFTSGTTKIVVDPSGATTFNALSGSGNGYACLNASGTLYRSATACN